MPITVTDLVFRQSERMTDNDDGGGQMSAVEIVSGAENSVFDDLSDVDRAAGDVSIRKVYAAVLSDGPDKYLDAGVVVFRPPADPAVSVLAFSTGSFYDERSQLKDRLESSISRGATYMGWLWGPHGVGQRALMLWQRPEVDLPELGRRLELVARAGTVELYSQVVWITRVVDELVTRYDVDGAYQIRSVVCELAEPLRQTFEGVEPSRIDPGTPPTVIYSTRYNPDAVPIQGIAPLIESAGVGDRTLRVSSLYSPLIPTAFTETALADTTPGGDTIALVGTQATTISFATSLNVVGPSLSLFLGSAALPGTVAVAVGGATLLDDNGRMRLAGLEVGVIDYGAGVIRWNSSCPAYGTQAKTVTLRPAARPLRVADTATQVVTVENRGFVWVITLTPIPQPGTLRVAYRVNNEWYVLSDQGAGQLAGADSSYGTGQINFTTGTVMLTTGGLPDAESEILYAWSTAVEYLDRSSIAPPAVVLRGQTGNPNVLPGTVAITWLGGSLADADEDGFLTGTGGEGRIVYRTGAWWVLPSTVPAIGTEFNVDYEYGDPGELVTDTWTGPALSEEGLLELTLSEPPKPGTLVLTVDVTVADFVEQTGSVAEDLPPAPPLPANPDADKPGLPAVTYRLQASLLNAECHMTAYASGPYSYAEALAAAAAVNAVGVVSTSSSTGAFTVAGIQFQKARSVSLFGGTCALSSWKITCSPGRK